MIKLFVLIISSRNEWLSNIHLTVIQNLDGVGGWEMFLLFAFSAQVLVANAKEKKLKLHYNWKLYRNYIITISKMKSNCGGTAFKGNILSKTLQNKPRANTNPWSGCSEALCSILWQVLPGKGVLLWKLWYNWCKYLNFALGQLPVWEKQKERRE